MKTKSNLFFLLSFEDINGQGTECSSDQITWPICTPDGEVIDFKMEKVFRDVFQASKLLHPFTMKISGLMPNAEEKCLFVTGKNWIAIYLEEKEVLCLHAYTDNPHWEFTSILELPEIMPMGKATNPDEIAAVLQWSSIENWIRFFCAEITERSIQEIADGDPIYGKNLLDLCGGVLADNLL